LRDDETACISVKVPLTVKERLNEIAFEESTPTQRVTMSDVARDALTERVTEEENDNKQEDE
jgi:hypothetical protein